MFEPEVSNNKYVEDFSYEDCLMLLVLLKDKWEDTTTNVMAKWFTTQEVDIVEARFNALRDSIKGKERGEDFISALTFKCMNMILENPTNIH